MKKKTIIILNFEKNLKKTTKISEIPPNGPIIFLLITS